MAMSHPAPLFLCLPGSKNYGGDALKNQVAPADWNGPNTWPIGSKLRIKVMDNPKPFDVITKVVTDTINSWMAPMTNLLVHEWVTVDPADIRISFRPDEPNWSCHGVMAKMYDSTKATMNLSFGEWQTKQAIYPHTFIARVAAHMFGHALGLPHASFPANLRLDVPKVSALSGTYFMNVAAQDSGWSALQSDKSIMRFDRPLGMVPGLTADLSQGGNVVDQEARDALTKAMQGSVFYIRASTTFPPYCGPGDSPEKHRGLQEKQTFDAISTNNAVAGLSCLDLDYDRPWRAFANASSTVPGKLDLQIGTWSDTCIWRVDADVLAFDSKRKIQVGTSRRSKTPGSGTNFASDKIKFSTAFKQQPKIVVFFNSLEMNLYKGFSINCTPGPATDGVAATDGFNLNHWIDTMVAPVSSVIDVVATFLAHEADDPGIRSGTCTIFPDKMVMTQDVTFSTPFPSKPRFVFVAMNALWRSSSATIRIACKAREWTNNSATIEAWSWVPESMMVSVGISYVAIL